MMRRLEWSLPFIVLSGAALFAALGYGLGSWGLAKSKLSASYRLVRSWTEAKGERFKEPHGIAVDPRNGNVLVCDTQNQRVVVLDPAGRFVRQLGREGNGPGEFSHPQGIAVGPDGTIYVSDFLQDRIQKFSEEGYFVLGWGKSGREKDSLDSPAGLTVDSKGNVYVADFYNRAVKVFSSEGKFLKIIGKPGQWGRGRLDYPTDVDMAKDGRLIVADAYNHRIQIFSPEGHVQAIWGYHLFRLVPLPSSRQRGFRILTSVAISPDQKRIHIADSRNHRIVMLDSKGSLITDWVLEDVGENIDTPVMLAVSPNGQKLYATDIVRHRVLVLEVIS